MFYLTHNMMAVVSFAFFCLKIFLRATIPGMSTIIIMHVNMQENCDINFLDFHFQSIFILKSALT